MKFLYSNLLSFTAQNKKLRSYTLYLQSSNKLNYFWFSFFNHIITFLVNPFCIYLRNEYQSNHIRPFPSPIMMVTEMAEQLRLRIMFLFIFQMIQKSSPCWSPALARTGTRNQFTVMQVSVTQFRSRSRICGTMSRPTRLTTRRASNGSTG